MFKPTTFLKPRVINIERLQLLLDTLNTNVVKDIWYSFKNEIKAIESSTVDNVPIENEYLVIDLHVILGSSYYIIKDINKFNLEKYIEVLEQTGVKIFTTEKELSWF